MSSVFMYPVTLEPSTSMGSDAEKENKMVEQ
jgi:hypothetical protein